MTDIITELIDCIDVNGQFTPMSFDTQITHCVEELRNFCNAATLLYHAADETEKVLAAFVPAKRAFEALYRGRPTFEDPKGGEI